MNSTFLKLISLATMTLTMMIAMHGSADAQSAPGTGMNIRGRIQTSAITVVDVKGEAVQMNVVGDEWRTLDTESTQDVVSALQLKVARQRRTAQPAIIGTTVTVTAMHEIIAQSDRVAEKGDGDELVACSTKIEKAE